MSETKLKDRPMNLLPLLLLLISLPISFSFICWNTNLGAEELFALVLGKLKRGFVTLAVEFLNVLVLKSLQLKHLPLLLFVPSLMFLLSGLSFLSSILFMPITLPTLDESFSDMNGGQLGLTNEPR